MIAEMFLSFEFERKGGILIANAGEANSKHRLIKSICDRGENMSGKTIKVNSYAFKTLWEISCACVIPRKYCMFPAKTGNRTLMAGLVHFALLYSKLTNEIDRSGFNLTKYMRQSI